MMELGIARIDHARDAFPSERILQRAFHYCGCITIRDHATGDVLCGVACLFVPEHRRDIVEPDERGRIVRFGSDGRRKL